MDKGNISKDWLSETMAVLFSDRLKPPPPYDNEVILTVRSREASCSASVVKITGRVQQAETRKLTVCNTLDRVTRVRTNRART
jgi:hypothetical protein